MWLISKFFNWLTALLYIQYIYIYIYISIHLSIFFRLSGAGSRGQQSKQRCPDFPLPRHFLQHFWGDTEAFPGQPGDIVSPACPRSSPGPPPGGTCPKHLPGKASMRHPEQIPEPPQLTLLDVEEQRLYSELLPSDWASHPISKGAPSHPTEKAHFGRLYPGSCPFGHDPKLMTIGESRNVDWPVNRELRLAAQLFLHHAQTGTSTALLQKLHRSVCQSPVPSFPHSWTRPPDTWTPPLEVATLHQPVVGKPPFSDWGPWPRIWRRWFSSQPLHTRLQTVPVHAEGPGLRWPTRHHHPQRAETKSRGPQTQHPPAPGCA